MALGGVAVPASAQTSAENSSDAAASLQELPDKYELAAVHSEDSPAELREAEAEGEIEVSDNGFINQIDEAHGSTVPGQADAPSASLRAAIPGDPAGGSRPGAPVTVYLDFDGETLAGTQWNQSSGRPSLAFTPAAAATEAVITEVWATVAEDFAPFDVNVTTVRPSDDQLYKTSADDAEYGVHVIITDSYDEVLPGAATRSGLAWLGGAGSQYLSGALVFTRVAGASAKNMADIASHEAGHNFGLAHDSIVGSRVADYYYPRTGVWGPIMGSTYAVPVTQWSRGDYAGATNAQDDLAMITDRSAAATKYLYMTTPDGLRYTGAVCPAPGVSVGNLKPGDVLRKPQNGSCAGAVELLTLHFTYTDRADYAADEAGDDRASASALANDGTFTADSVIERTADVDVFSILTAGGDVTARVDVADVSPNLDAKLTLTDATGAIIAENDDPAARVSARVASGLDASVSVTGLAPGRYYLSVDGVGWGDPTTATQFDSGGYSDYASLGRYTLSGTASAFVAEDIVIDSPEDGAVVDGGAALAVSGTATAGARVTLKVGGTVVATVDADGAGAWSATVTPNRFGDTEIVAAQTLSFVELPGPDTITVTAPVPVPVITAPVDGATTADPSPEVSGTGVPGATVTVSVSDGAGGTVTATALVDETGRWAVTMDALRAGDHTVTAAQEIDGVTSDAAPSLTFTITNAPVVTDPDGDGSDGDGGGDGGGDGAAVTGGLAATGGDLGGATISLLLAGVLIVAGGSVALRARARARG